VLKRATLIAATVWGLACGSSGGSCPNDLPMSCPSPTPSYTNDVAPLIQAHCVKCHSATGVEYSRPLDTYAGVTAQTGVLDQVYSCRMPPAPETPLTSAERAALFGWLVCNSPQN
jgi:uncharacterized membrane protein